MPTAISQKVVEIQRLWQGIYNLADCCPDDGLQWDRLFADGERFKIGNMYVEVLLTPGHTLASIAYAVGDAAFIHDSLFMPDGGTARADFPGGSASALWKSIQRILALPNNTRKCCVVSRAQSKRTEISSRHHARPSSKAFPGLLMPQSSFRGASRLECRSRRGSKV